MNILIADSGSTKTDWRLITSQEVESFSSSGINPHLLSDIEIQNLFESEIAPNISCEIDDVHFYGAGITSEEVQHRVANILECNINASKINIYTDLLGAAQSLFGDTNGVVGILGTGSNSCYYDGLEIVNKVESGGYILGDEGSGSALGKRLLKDYLRNKLPESLSLELTKSGLSKEKIIDNVYSQSRPNKYLASFSKFIYEHRQDEYCQQMIKLTLGEYVTNHLLSYQKSISIGLVGSIAYYYKEELEFLAAAVGLGISKIEKSPIEGLVNYHKPK